MAENRAPFLDGTSRPGIKETFSRLGVETYSRAYDQGMSMADWLESKDDTTQYPEGSVERSMTAFERMAAFGGGIRFRGTRHMEASTWADVCQSEQHRALVPEWLSMVWREASGHRMHTPEGQSFRASLLQSQDYTLGTLGNPYDERNTVYQTRLRPTIPLDRLLARTEQVRGTAWQQTYIVDNPATDDAYQMKRVPEGTEIPATRVVTGQREGRLAKFGRRIDATYEALRRLPLDRIRFIVGRIALRAELDKVSTVLSTAINGDGNPNTAARVVAVTSLDGTITPPGISYKAWLSFLMEFGNMYQADVILGRKDVVLSLMLLPVAVGGMLPLGAAGARGGFGSLAPIDRQNPDVLWGIAADAPSNRIVAMDTSTAIVRFQEIGGQISEVQRFVKDQTETLTLTEVEGYAVEDQNATIVLNEAA